MKLILLAALASAVLLPGVLGARPAFEQVSVQNDQGGRANGILFSRAGRCFVLTVDHVLMLGQFEIRTQQESGLAEQLKSYPEQDLGLLELLPRYFFLCDPEGVWDFALPSGMNGNKSTELAPADVTFYLKLRQGARLIEQQVEVVSENPREITIALDRAQGFVGWSGSILWRRTKYEHEAGLPDQPLAILQRLPSSPSRPESRNSERSIRLLRLDSAWKIIQPHLPQIRPEELLLRKEAQPEVAVGLGGTWVMTLYDLAKTKPAAKLLFAVDEGDWGPLPKKATLPPHARKLHIKLDPEAKSSKRLHGGPFEFDLPQLALLHMLELAKTAGRLVDCQGPHCKIRVSGILPALKAIRMGTRPDNLDQVFELGIPLDKYARFIDRIGDRLLPSPLCGGQLFYQLELVDGYKTAVLSTPNRRHASMCPDDPVTFQDPRHLLSKDPGAIPVYIIYTGNLFENRVQLDTFLGFEVETVLAAFGDQRKNEGALIKWDRKIKIDAKELTLKFGLIDGTWIGPFLYEVDFVRLKRLASIVGFDKVGYLRCFPVTPDTVGAAFKRAVTERKLLCRPQQSLGSAPLDPWIAIAQIEAGLQPDKLTQVHTIDPLEVPYEDCDRYGKKCFLAITFPPDVEEVYARVQFFNGRWTDILRFRVF